MATTITLNKKMLTNSGNTVIPILIDGSVVQCIDNYGKVIYYNIEDLFTLTKQTQSQQKKTTTPAPLTIISSKTSPKISAVLPTKEEILIKSSSTKEQPKEEVIESIELEAGKLEKTISGKYNYTAPLMMLRIDVNITAVYSVYIKSEAPRNYEEEMIIVLPKGIPIVNSSSNQTKKNIYVNNEDYV